MYYPKVLISILNWNNAEMTIQCVHSVLKNISYPTDCYKIILVDNASVDNSYKDLVETFPEIDIIRANQNSGFAAGHFLSYQKEKENSFDLLWILNNDLQINKTSLPALVAAYRVHGDGIFGSISTNKENKVEFGGLQEIYDFKVPDNTEDIYYGKPISAIGFPRTYWTSNIHGFSMLIPVSIIKKHGFMNLDFFMYHEESEYCFRLLLHHKIKSYIVQQSVVRHETSASFRRGNKLKYIKDYYISRNAHLLGRLVYKYKKRSYLKQDIKSFWTFFYLLVPKTLLFPLFTNSFVQQY